MKSPSWYVLVLCLVPILAASGCQSPYRADQGALFGGLMGAAAGAAVGQAVGNPGAGAAIGAGVGATSGAMVGAELDQIEAQNRAMIAQQLGRQVAAQPVAIGDVLAMSQAGVGEELIVNHIRAHGVAAPLSTDEVIMLHEQGVSTRVIKAMQEQPAQVAVRPSSAAVIVHESPPPVVLHEYRYGPPWRRPHYQYDWRYHHRRPGVSWGFSVGH